MCDEKHCQRDGIEMCSCGPIKSGDTFLMTIHLAENITDVSWRLTYKSLKEIHPYRLCMVGVCKSCGGRLCIEHKPFDTVTTEEFLEAAYQHLYQFRHNMDKPLSREDIRVKFVEMFRKEDQPFVEEWLAKPENSDMAWMYRRSMKKTNCCDDE